MGWVIVLALAIIAGAALWRFGKLPRVAREPVLLALMLGIAGYALQGSPGLPGHDVVARPQTAPFDEKAVLLRNQLGQRFGREAAWLIASDGALRAGLTQSAATYVKSGLRDYPNSADLWVGLGNALVAHGEGQVSPAAVYAFRKAATIAPDAPGPAFYLGTALAQTGDLEKARTIWAALLARSPADAPWRQDLAMRIAMIDAMSGRTR